MLNGEPAVLARAIEAHLVQDVDDRKHEALLLAPDCGGKHRFSKRVNVLVHELLGGGWRVCARRATTYLTHITILLLMYMLGRHLPVPHGDVGIAEAVKSGQITANRR